MNQGPAADGSYLVKNLDSGEHFTITDVDQYCKFDDFDTFSNGGVQFEVKMCGNNRVVPSTGGSFTVYEMEVTERKGDTRRWQFAKRYSDFVALHEILNDAGYGVGSIQAALPPKRWFGNLEGDVVTLRQRALERYMTLCLQCASPDDCTAVRNFLNSSTIPLQRSAAGSGPLPITPPSFSRGTSEDFGSARGTGSEGFEPRSFNEEERALSNMLTLDDMGDDGAPTPVKDITQVIGEDDGEDGEFVTIRRAQLQDLLSERETLYAEILRYKDENTVLFRDLGTAEDMVDALQDQLEELKAGGGGGEGGGE
ncbi:hypothetical protein TrLO_g2194 [Triparma laevis f. longispina]|uniref:PX domain-containing protein n=1 Tax=Triparma laevis f. longispina TaxID=1714387 RepID=A0A9W6ZZ45_9STRA|nr:hypothetical protein TrLO_g2194 [Triparma laevis f. longispina]